MDNHDILNLLKSVSICVVVILLLTACFSQTSAPIQEETINKQAGADEATANEVDPVENPIRRTEAIFSRDQEEGSLTIRFFELEAEEKSGDAIFLTSPDGKTMLIDSGTVLTGPKVDEYLQKLGVDTIDYAIATHPHHDHIGGYHTLLRSKQINHMYMANIPHETETNTTFMQLIEQNGIDYEFLEDGDRFSFGDEIEVAVFNPPAGTGPDTLPEELSTTRINNLSLVLKLTYKDTSFLFTGDIYKSHEAILVEEKGELLQADLMDAPHHGDSTSSSSALIEAVNPTYTVFSANIFQSKRVYDRYRDHGSEVYVTGVDGHILVISDGKEIQVITERDREGDYLQ